MIVIELSNNPQETDLTKTSSREGNSIALKKKGFGNLIARYMYNNANNGCLTQKKKKTILFLGTNCKIYVPTASCRPIS